MALGTLPDSDEEKKLNPNESDKTFRDTFGVDKGLRDIENFANDEKNHANGGIDQNKSLDDLENGMGGSYANNFTGKGTQPGGGKRKLRFSWKKQGPAAAVITVIGGGIGLAGLMSPSLVMVHLMENMVNKYNYQGTSLEVRFEKMLVSKLTGGKSHDSCDTSSSYVCRLTRPSTYFLKKLQANGVTPQGGSTLDTSSTSEFPDSSPSSYEFVDDTGKTTTIDSSQVASEFSNDANFAAEVHDVYNPEFASFSDNTFRTIELEDGFSKRDPLQSAKDEKTATKEVDTIGEPSESSSNPEEQRIASKIDPSSDTASEAEVDDIITEEVDNNLKDLGKESSKGGVTAFVAGTVCTLSNVPGMISKTVRVYQMTQVIRYAMAFLAVSSALKAGNASPQEVATIGTLLTSVVKGHSAMDSFGVRSTLFGDTNSSSDKNWKKFIPGGSGLISTLSSYNVYFNKDMQDFCQTGVPALSAGVDLATSETIVVPLVNAIGGLAAGVALEAAAPAISSFITTAIGPIIEQILPLFLGNLTSNLTGMDVGDALTSGASNMMSQTAAQGGNTPLSPSQAVAYEQVTQKVQLAYAKEAQATLSPLDPNSNYTFMGSIINHLLPFTGTMSSAQGVLSTIGSVTTSAFGSIFQPAANAADPQAQYTQCDDPGVTNSNVAAGPFCNVVYGVPTQYLNIDPTQVATDLQDQINQSDGTPISGSDLEKWQQQCLGNDLSTLNVCKVTNQTDAEYSLYTIDHRIQTAMDGEDSVYTQSMTPSSDTNSSTTSAYNPIAQFLGAFL